jgi:hypothetical protein
MTNKVLMIVSLASLMAAGSGCILFVAGAAAGAGVGTYAYVNGETKATVGASLDRSWSAALAAMKDMEFPVTSQGKDALVGELTARSGSDKKITISLKKLSDTATEIRIRAGAFGDESLSRIIFEKINQRLGGQS